MCGINLSMFLLIKTVFFNLQYIFFNFERNLLRNLSKFLQILSSDQTNLFWESTENWGIEIMFFEGLFFYSSGQIWVLSQIENFFQSVDKKIRMHTWGKKKRKSFLFLKFCLLYNGIYIYFYFKIVFAHDSLDILQWPLFFVFDDLVIVLFLDSFKVFYIFNKNIINF